MESPLNKAHQRAANADEYVSQGLLIPASEEHRKAAEGFRECIEASNDENAKRTLKMLYNEHSKAEKDLERRIAKLREENKDPSLPQISQTHRRPAGQPVPRPPSSPPPQSKSRMTDSQNTADESFMLLGQRSDPGDILFNQFWKVTTELLENISQPVAFASAPLGYPPSQKKDTGSNSDTDVDDGIAVRLSRKMGLTKQGSDNSFTTARENSIVGQEFDEVLADEDDELVESFCFIPAGNEPTRLRKENASLKADIANLKEKLATAEAALKARQEQDQVLRGNIISARKQAQRAMTASSMGQSRPLPDFGSLNLTVSPAAPAPGRDREAQLTRRVRELEEDVKVLRAVNESQKQVIDRFRDKWNGLKETAKKKKEAKAAATSQAVREKIIEEPEPEEPAA